MASTKNAFDLLSGGGGGGAPAAAGKKKRGKGKKVSGANANGTEPGEPAAPTAAPIMIAPSRTEEPQLCSLKEAAEGLEAAAVAATAGERGALAQDWADKVAHGDDALFADGSGLADFRQVLLRSRAVELLLEGALTRGATAAEAPGLAALLAAVAHPLVPRAYAAALAQAAVSLGGVAAADPLAPTPAAKRSAAAALVLLKSGTPKPPPAKPAEAPAAKLKRLGAELGRAEARLPSTSTPKELGKTYGSILELLCGQLDVLRPGGAAGAQLAPELAAAIKPLDELRASLSARLQEVQAPPKPALSVQEQVAQAEAAHAKADSAAASRLSEVEARVAELEAELAALRSEAGDLKARRAAAAQHHKLRVEQIRSGKAESGATPAQIAAAVKNGLGALDGLAAAVRAGGGDDGAAAAAPLDTAALGQAVVAAEVPVKLLGAMQQVVELGVGQMADLGAKARFFRERLEKAIKQGEQAAKLGLGDPKAFAQQRATAEKNVKDTIGAAEAAVAACRGAVAAYRERLPLMLRLPTFLPPPPDFLPSMEARVAEAEATLDAIKAGTYTPPAAAAPAAPAAAAAGTGGGDDLAALEKRLAALEVESSKKDAQIAAMVGSSTLEVPSPLAGRTSMPPAMLSSPTSNKPVGPAAPAAAPGPAAAHPAAVGPAAPAAAPGPAAAHPAAVGVAAPAGAPISFSQALQANGAKKGRPRRA